MISGNKSVTKRTFIASKWAFLVAKVTIIFQLTKQKANFLSVTIWDAAPPPDYCRHIWDAARRMQGANTPPEGTPHRYCQHHAACQTFKADAPCQLSNTPSGMQRDAGKNNPLGCFGLFWIDLYWFVLFHVRRMQHHLEPQLSSSLQHHIREPETPPEQSWWGCREPTPHLGAKEIVWLSSQTTTPPCTNESSINLAIAKLMGCRHTTSGASTITRAKRMG